MNSTTTDATRSQVAGAFSADFDILDTLPEEARKRDPWAESAALDWTSEPEEIEEALQVITELASRVYVIDRGARDRKLITEPGYLDFAHFSVKLPGDGMGALLTVSVPPRAAESVTGRLEWPHASQFVGESRPFEEIMLYHRDRIGAAIRAAKPIIQARTN